MDWELTSQARTIFEDLLDCDPADRLRRLESACGSNPELRAEVESLLAAHAEPGGLLDVSIPESFAGAAPDRAAHRAGPYEIIRPIGRGGMAVVYLARRIDGLYDKTVALKLVDRAHSSPELEAAFLRELRVLSRLEHPNVVRLLDGGITADGLFFMVMELVDGKPLDVWCTENALNIAARVRLFQQVCDTVSYAHRNLVVHRDLKPTNILVAPDGAPKLLDFGIAKTLDEGDRGRPTASQGRMTIEYASPEQVRSGVEASTTTDVYSLGVILFELLTGRLPYQTNSPLAHEVARAILEDEPLRPHGVPPELQAVVLKALRKDPAERYPSVDYLRDDLDRWLTHQPVLAFRGSRRYAAAKFLRRHRVALLLVGAFTLTIAAGVIQTVRAERRAQRYLADVLAISNDYAGQISSRPFLRRQTIQDMGATRKYLLDLAHSNGNSLEVRQHLADLLLTVGDLQSYPTALNIGDTRGALETLREAVRVSDELYRSRPGDPAFALRAAAARCAAGTILIEMNRYADALPLFNSAVEINAHLSPGAAGYQDRRLSYAQAIAHLSRIRLHEGNQEECLRLRAESVAIRREVLATRDPSMYRREVGGSLATYGWALREFGHYPEALAAYEESTALADEEFRAGARSAPGDLLLKAKNKEQMCRILVALGRHREAALAVEESVATYRNLAVAEPEDAASRRGLAVALALLAERQAADGVKRAVWGKTMREALTISRAAVAADPENQKAGEELSRIRAVAQKLGVGQ